MKSAWLTLVKIAVAVALAFFVISQIQVKDSVLCPAAEQNEPGGEPDAASAEPVRIFGEITGDWRSQDWRFVSTDGTRELTPSTLGDCELRPGFFTTLAGLRWLWFGLTLALWTVLVVIVGWRWQLLLRAAGVTTSYGNAMRLCFIGYFFNNVMPGQTGGDLIRAVLVAKRLESGRANAAMSVLIDRILGLFSLLLLAGVVLAFGSWKERADIPQHQIGRVAMGVFLIIGIVMVGGGLYLSRRFRRFVRLDALLGKLPEGNFIRKIDGAITLYRNHLPIVFLALGMSLFLQVCAVTSFWAMSEALGGAVALADCFVLFPVVQTISAVPVAPAGWGIGESLFGVFFRWFGSSFTLGVAVSVLFRLTTQLGFGLIGGIIWVLSREHKQGLKLNEVKP